MVVQEQRTLDGSRPYLVQPKRGATVLLKYRDSLLRLCTAYGGIHRVYTGFTQGLHRVSLLQCHTSDQDTAIKGQLSLETGWKRTPLGIK